MGSTRGRLDHLWSQLYSNASPTGTNAAKMAGEDNGSGNGITRALSRLWNGNGGPEEESLTDWFKLVSSVHTAGIAERRHGHRYRLSVVWYWTEKSDLGPFRFTCDHKSEANPSEHMRPASNMHTCLAGL